MWSPPKMNIEFLLSTVLLMYMPFKKKVLSFIEHVIMYRSFLFLYNSDLSQFVCQTFVVFEMVLLTARTLHESLT